MMVAWVPVSEEAVLVPRVLEMVVQQAPEVKGGPGGRPGVT